MALGTSIRLPREYFENSTPVELYEESTVQPASQYDKTLCSFMNSLRNTIPHYPKKQPTYVDPLLFRCSQVFVRIDSVKSPLQRPYSGPHFVLERHDKYFVIEKDGHTDTVTIDRLKPAFVEPKFPTDSSDEEETSETLSFPPTSSSKNDNTLAGELDELPANFVYSLPNPYAIAIKFYRYLVWFNIFISCCIFACLFVQYNFFTAISACKILLLFFQSLCFFFFSGICLLYCGHTT